jgi:hypothetical protein
MMNSLVRWNLNPIEEMERSFVIFNSFIQHSHLQRHGESDEKDSWEVMTTDQQMRKRMTQKYSLERICDEEKERSRGSQ